MDDVEVETCDSAPEALERIESDDYDAIVSDIKMPGMDGLALLAEIKKLPPGHADPADHRPRRARPRRRRRCAGARTTSIQKPIDRDYFVASLERAIQMRQLDRQVEQRSSRSSATRSVLDHVGDGVFLVDEGGVVQLWNPAADGHHRAGPEAVVGRPARECDSRAGRRSRRSCHVAASPGDRDGAARRRCPSSSTAGSSGCPSRACSFGDATVYAFRDLTAERAIDELKDEFLATASHELRTPLGGHLRRRR